MGSISSQLSSTEVSWDMGQVVKGDSAKETGASSDHAESSFVPMNRWALVVAACLFLLSLAIAVTNFRAPDYVILHFINRFARRSWLFDTNFINLNKDMFAILPIVTMLWYLWFRSDDARRRAVILAGVVVAMVVGTISRSLQLLVPTHLRPDLDPALYFTVPYGYDPSGLSHWSSFPSDHAEVLFALASIVFVMDRRIGRWAYVLVTTVCVERMYFGCHCPTDTIAGAALGVLAAGLAVRLGALSRVRKLVNIAPARTPLFYAVAFYVCFGVATLFMDCRSTASGWTAAAAHFAHIARHHHSTGALAAGLGKTTP